MITVVFYYYVWIGIYSVWLVAIKYRPMGIKENVLSITITGNVTVSIQISIASSNYTIFGFCHDSLNLLNSVTLI